MKCMLKNSTVFVEFIQQSPSIISKHLHKNTSIAVKMVKHADSSNLMILQSLIEDRRSQSKKAVDSQFEMRIQEIDNSNVLVIKSSYLNWRKIPFENNSLMSSITQSLINEMIRGDNKYFYTHDNVKLDPYTHEIFTNLTSNVGILFLLKKKPIQKKQFSEIYELLEPGMFQQKNLKEKMHYRVKFRTLAIFILSFVVGKKLDLFFEADNYEKEITFQDAQKSVSLLFDRYVELLSNKRIVKKIRELQDRDKANYAFFLKRVFLDQCKGLTWGEVISLLVFRYKSVKPHTNIFIDFANQLYQQNSSGRNQAWATLLNASGVDIGKIIRFQSFEEYIRTEKNWNEDKERVCMTVLQLLNKLEQNYKKRSQIKEFLEKQQQFTAQNQQPAKQNSTFTRFGQIYKIVQTAIGYYRAKVNQTQIKYMSNEKRILTKYMNL